MINWWIVGAWIVVVVAGAIGLWLLSILFQVLVYHLFNKIPFMCENCGHTFTDDEDPSQRCPVCNSY